MTLSSLTRACLLLTASGALAAPPNIVLIMVDDLGPEWISSYGGEGIETPNIDKLAAGGMVFLNAYSMPQCTPTRVTLLTGQYPFRHGWTNHWDVPRWGAGCHFDPASNPSVARLLREAGYATAIAGKWQINDFRVQPGVLNEHGFDEWAVWTGGEGGNPASDRRYWDPYIYTSKSASRTYEGAFGPDIYNEFLIDFVERHKDGPMFLYYPMALTHGPLVATPHEPFAETRMERHKAMVRYTDYLVGRLVRALDDAGIRDNTIVIFTTDNGSSRGITGRMNGRAVQGGKGRLTENGPRQPFIANGPGLVPAGVTTEALTDFSDLLPTFCELSGAQVPEDFEVDGRSIADVLLGKRADGPRQWMLAMGFGPATLDDRGVRGVLDYAPRVIRDKRHKVHVHDGMVTEFYDLREDPWEERNLVGTAVSEHIRALAKLRLIVASMPERDARPRYVALPPQPWDRKRESVERR
ncbi:MAG: sulfatase-like hydrolase/transferase [Bryobacterales bacterium]|nr:sulfatase-like hydrolase/transferase [Bryobacterales bacterium]